MAARRDKALAGLRNAIGGDVPPEVVAALDNLVRVRFVPVRLNKVSHPDDPRDRQYLQSAEYVALEAAVATAAAEVEPSEPSEKTPNVALWWWSVRKMYLAARRAQRRRQSRKYYNGVNQTYRMREARAAREQAERAKQAEKARQERERERTRARERAEDDRFERGAAEAHQNLAVAKHELLRADLAGASAEELLPLRAVVAMLASGENLGARHNRAMLEKTRAALLRGARRT